MGVAQYLDNVLVCVQSVTPILAHCALFAGASQAFSFPRVYEILVGNQASKLS